MSLKTLKRIFKQLDGGVLKFKDQHQQRTYYFEMNYAQFLPIYKSLKNNANDFYILHSDGKHQNSSLESITNQFPNNHNMNTIIRDDKNTYGICDKAFMIRLLNNMSCPELDDNYQEDDVTYNYTLTFYNNASSKPQSSKPIARNKKPRKRLERFDWAEEYEEGLRIFEDDEDQAEAYADEMKRKKTGRI